MVEINIAVAVISIIPTVMMIFLMMFGYMAFISLEDNLNDLKDEIQKWR